MIPARLQSRKLWVTILAGALIGGLEAAGVDVDSQTIYAIVALAVGYDATQGAVDLMNRK